MRISPLHAADGSMDPEVNAEAKGVIKVNYLRPSNRAYTAMLRAIVRNCVDVIVLNEHNEALMGWRVNEPWKARWHPSGGGQVNGDSYGETAALHLKRDLGLTVDPERFEFVNSASFPWSTSAQGVPCHMNGVLVVVRLTSNELSARSVPKTGDFANSHFCPLTDVTVEKGFHPAIALGARIILHNQDEFNRLGTIDPKLL